MQTILSLLSFARPGSKLVCGPLEPATTTECDIAPAIDFAAELSVAPSVPRVTATELWRMFDTNEADAEHRFAHRPLYVSGAVDVGVRFRLRSLDEMIEITYLLIMKNFLSTIWIFLAMLSGCGHNLNSGDKDAPEGSAAWAVAQAIPVAEEWQSDAIVAKVDSGSVLFGVAPYWAVTFVSRQSQTGVQVSVATPDYGGEVSIAGSPEGSPLPTGLSAEDMELAGWQVDTTDVPGILEVYGGLYVGLAMPAWTVTNTFGAEQIPDEYLKTALYWVIDECPRADIYSAKTGDTVLVIEDYLAGTDSGCDG